MIKAANGAVDAVKHAGNVVIDTAEANESVKAITSIEAVKAAAIEAAQVVEAIAKYRGVEL